MAATSTGGSNSAGGGGNSTGGIGANGGTSSAGGNVPTGGVPVTGGSKAAGGAANTGGMPATGGTQAAAGATATGGTPATGGATGNGGTAATGGTVATGGSKAATGGMPATGGTVATGGSKAATGGTVATGGSKAATGGTPATGGMPATGGATSNDCTAPPEAPALIGWAAVSGSGTTTTTGGGNATPTTVTTLAALQSAASGSTAAVIYVKGTLAAGKITVGSNKTIAGICGAEIHGHIEMSGSVNVIIRNIKIVGYAVGDCSLDPDYDSSVGCSSGNDAISLQKNAHHVWFDHCDISDGTDGNLDITNAANYVTVSWTKFHYTPRSDNSGSDSTGASGHRFSNLIGGTDTPSTYDDANALNVTWHHDWWADNVMQRMPRVRFGKNHLFNDLWTCSGNDDGIGVGVSCNILDENGIFIGIKTPMTTTHTNSSSIIQSKGVTYQNCTGKTADLGGTAFTPSYTYTLDATNTVQATVESGAGPK